MNNSGFKVMYDYHLHSEFSDDSRASMEAQIERGIALGLAEMCFTDHVDYGIKKDWTDAGEIGWRGGDGIGTPKSSLEPLTNVHYPEYFAKLYRMKRTYGDKIAIKNGLEFGIQVHTIPQYEKLIQDYGDQLDFVLCSIHQVEDKEFWTGDFMKGRTQDEYNERYYQEMLDVVKAFKGYDVLAHVDLIARYDPAGPIAFEKIQGILTEIFKIVIADGKGIELNTSSWHYGLKDTTPSRDILKLYQSLGGRVLTMGSDAHKPEFLANHMQDAQAILRDLGFKEIYTFDHHKPIAHAL